MDKVLVIVGPTGIGRAAFPIQLAKAFHGEIISGDSMQVYDQMDIGTAKITKEEMEGIPHYLVGIQAYDKPYNVKIVSGKGQEIHSKNPSKAEASDLMWRHRSIFEGGLI